MIIGVGLIGGERDKESMENPSPNESPQVFTWTFLEVGLVQYT